MNKTLENYFFRFDAVVLPYIAAFSTAFYLYVFHESDLKFVAGASIAAWLLAFFLKVIFRKARPNNLVAKTIFPAEGRFSFPSEHSAVFAALGTSVYAASGPASFLLLAAAMLIGISRVKVGVHFWRDIIVGWGIGILIGLLFI